MTTVAIVGAGPGLGAAAARRFGRGGFDVALLSVARRTSTHSPPSRPPTATARGYAGDVPIRLLLRAAPQARAAAGGLATR
jgi:NAD(P)-dependent dehydrogenase (short-subunit alcohol dehydrogenase family)